MFIVIIKINNVGIGMTNPLNNFFATEQFYTVDIDVATKTIFPSTTNISVIALLIAFIASSQSSTRTTHPCSFEVGSIIKDASTVSTTFHSGANI